MPQWSDNALVLSTRPHGETSLLLYVLSCTNGRRAGLVRGGQSRKMRGVLEQGNEVSVEWRARLAEHLGSMTAELITPYASRVMDDALRLAGLASICAVIEGCVSEGEPCPRLFSATQVLIEMLADDTPQEVWLAAYIRWEIGILDIAGYALNLGSCAVTGAREGLAFVSPRTGAAVSRAGAGVHVSKLLRLSQFLGGVADEDEKTIEQDVLDGMQLTQHFLEKKVFAAHHRPLPPQRERLAALAEHYLSKAN